VRNSDEDRWPRWCGPDTPASPPTIGRGAGFAAALRGAPCGAETKASAPAARSAKPATIKPAPQKPGEDPEQGERRVGQAGDSTMRRGKRHRHRDEAVLGQSEQAVRDEPQFGTQWGCPRLVSLRRATVAACREHQPARGDCGSAVIRLAPHGRTGSSPAAIGCRAQRRGRNAVAAAGVSEWPALLGSPVTEMKDRGHARLVIALANAPTSGRSTPAVAWSFRASQRSNGACATQRGCQPDVAASHGDG
jgi:hypothetical protein